MSVNTVDKRKLSEDLANLIPVFHQTFIHQVNLPLPPNHFLTLIILDNHGTLTIRELSSKLLISKQQMSPIIDRLCRSGYIKREQDRLDRRNINITLLPSGNEILAHHQEKLITIVEKKISDAPEKDLAELHHTVQAFFKLFNKIS